LGGDVSDILRLWREKKEKHWEALLLGRSALAWANLKNPGWHLLCADTDLREKNENVCFSSKGGSNFYGKTDSATE